MQFRTDRGFFSPLPGLTRACAIAVVAACLPVVAAAAVPWHADLTQAKAASQISRRPVLVLFVAAWNEASTNHDKTFLASEEAVALLTACFEPVRVDVDADPATVNRLQVILHLPCACVIDADERVLARFDCPPSTAGFVAAAGRAAQEAAVACAGPLPKAPQASPPALVSDSGAPPAPPAADPATAGPALAATPPNWPAEVAAAPLGAAAAAPAPPTVPATSTPIEPSAPAAPAPPPAATGLASSLPNWLNPKPTAPTAPAPATPTAPEEKKPSGFWATVQKPFTSLVGKTPKAPTEAAGDSVPAEMLSTGVPGSDPGASMPVGLEGYCAVSLIDKRIWVEGRAKWGVRHRGRTYLFAGPEEQKAFLANPDRYAPGLSGDDPVLATDLGKKVPGQRQYGVSYRSKVYLFSSPDTKAAFEADPQKYAQRVQVAEQPTGANVR
jgi:YHS domain-containing protein